MHSILSAQWPHRASLRSWTRLWAAITMVCATAVAATPSLRDVLTADEFERAGLNKLTSKELEFLSARLLGQRPQPTAPVTAVAPTIAPTTPAAAASKEATFGQEEQIVARATAAGPKEIRSRIPGKFEGWSGRTVFALENGQVWQQTDPGELVVRLDSPEVIIRRGAFGAFYLRVAGYGAQAKVKRIK